MSEADPLLLGFLFLDFPPFVPPVLPVWWLPVDRPDSEPSGFDRTCLMGGSTVPGALSLFTLYDEGPSSLSPSGESAEAPVLKLRTDIPPASICETDCEHVEAPETRCTLPMTRGQARVQTPSIHRSSISWCVALTALTSPELTSWHAALALEAHPQAARKDGQ